MTPLQMKFVHHTSGLNLVILTLTLTLTLTQVCNQSRYEINLANSSNLVMSPFKIIMFKKPMNTVYIDKSIGQCAYPPIISTTALWYNGHQLEPNVSVSRCIYDSAICMESFIFFPLFHYYKDGRISVVGMYHIVGPAMPKDQCLGLALRASSCSVWPAPLTGALGSHGYGSHHFPWSIGYWPIPCHGQSVCHKGVL